MGKQFTRPPRGLTPRFLVDESRLKAISEAMERRTAVLKPIPFEWIEEYNELTERLEKRRSHNE